MPKPCLKFAGGKTRLLPEILPELPKRIRTYYEPFLGGGAVFFALAEQRRYEHAVLSDINVDLVDTYKAIREDVHSVIGGLESMQPYAGERDHYYEVRDKDVSQALPWEKAARFIFLNKCGFNGLYRVNKQGKFNVPAGKFAKSPKLFDMSNMLEVSKAFQNVELLACDYKVAIKPAKCGDAIYCDPPYVPVSETSNFTTYTANGFGMEDQIRLCSEAYKKGIEGVCVVVSNSIAAKELYENESSQIKFVSARRNINSKGTKRGPVEEILVVFKS